MLNNTPAHPNTTATHSSSNLPVSLLPKHNSTLGVDLAQVDFGQAAQQASNPVPEKHSFVGTALKSNTTSSAVANSLFASIFINYESAVSLALTIIPVVAHVSLGFLGVRNEQKALNQTKPPSPNIIVQFFRQPGIMRRFQAAVWAYQAVISVPQFKIFDTIMFTAGAIGNNAAATATNRYAESSTKESSAKLSQNRFSALFSSPGPWWVSSDLIAGLRGITFAGAISLTSPISSLFVMGSLGLGLVLSAYTFKSALTKMIWPETVNNKKDDALACLLSTGQLMSFSAANFCCGNFVTATCLFLWSLSSAMMARQIYFTK